MFSEVRGVKNSLKIHLNTQYRGEWGWVAHSIPVNNVGQEVVVLEPVVDIHLLVVDSQRPIQYASLLQFKGSISKTFWIK